MDSALTSFLLMLVVDEEAAAIFRSNDPKMRGLRQMLIDSAVPKLSDEAKLVLMQHDLNGIRTAINSTQFGNPPPLEEVPAAVEAAERAAAPPRAAKSKGRRSSPKRSKNR